MLTLTLDTSTHRGTVALGKNGSILAECSWDKESSHSEKLVTEIAKLFKTAGCELKDTQQIICGIGPGSFTGIRVALSFARTLANSNQLSVIAVEACWAIALNAVNTTVPISVVLNAQKNMYFYGDYQWNGTILETLHTSMLVSTEDFIKLAPTHHSWITNVPEFFSQQKIPISNVEPFPSAAKIYAQVFHHPQKHKEIHWQELNPLYLRASAAEEVLALKKK